MDPTEASLERGDEMPTALFFTMLPREIRDMIYMRAHSTGDKGFKIIPLSRWVKAERIRREVALRTRSALQPISHAVCPLENLTVCHQYYDEATVTWFRSKTISTDNIDELLELATDNLRIRDNILELDMNWRDSMFESLSPFAKLSKFYGLRRLKLRVDDSVFDTLFNKLACVHVLGASDFARMQDVQWLLEKLQPLDEITIEPCESKIAVTDDEREIWMRNVQGLQSYVKEMLEREADEEVTNHDESLQGEDEGPSVANDAETRRPIEYEQQETAEETEWHNMDQEELNDPVGEDDLEAAESPHLSGVFAQDYPAIKRLLVGLSVYCVVLTMALIVLACLILLD